jgi:hypothetical protein
MCLLARQMFLKSLNLEQAHGPAFSYIIIRTITIY